MNAVVEGEAGFLDILTGIFGKEEPETRPTYNRIESIAIVGTSFGSAEDVTKVSGEEVGFVGRIVAEGAIAADEFGAIDGREGIGFKLL